MVMASRNLNSRQIDQLTAQGCIAADWRAVSIDPATDLKRFRNVHFAGQVRIGAQTESVEVKPGLFRPAGICDSYLNNCTVGADVFINQVRYLVNYRIGDHVIIDDVAEILVSGETRFGNGTTLDVLNEGGGRGLPIFEGLTAQIAYLIVVYRHKPALQKKLTALIEAFADSRISSVGEIGSHARITHSNSIRSVAIGKRAQISGAELLEDGMLASNDTDPVVIGEGVNARHFIIQSGSRVENGVLLDKCFVGQGVRLGKQYSAENSVFFANCEGFHGEAVSLFAGPYTVTHHKSTLLIAGMFSFYNAGSGSNQSNHMYKLGPVHQGILERGSKTGSFSYLLWPSRVGAFSVVIGKHYNKFDASEFPFSYIMEDQGKSVLIPAINLFTVGTRRDSYKWPTRDRRRDPDKLDVINFEFFSVYLIEKVRLAAKRLQALLTESTETDENIHYRNLSIKRASIPGRVRYYAMMIDVFIGNEVAKKLESVTEALNQDAIDRLLSTHEESYEGWLDMAGLIAPAQLVEDIERQVEESEIQDFQALREALIELDRRYPELAWAYCLSLIRELYGPQIDIRRILIQIIQKWAETVEEFIRLILKDARKEFDAEARIGYGKDGDETIRDCDFEAVRGTYEKNKFVTELQQEALTYRARAERLVAALR